MFYSPTIISFRGEISLWKWHDSLLNKIDGLCSRKKYDSLGIEPVLKVITPIYLLFHDHKMIFLTY